MEATLLDHTHDPLAMLYLAYRACYSKRDLMAIQADLAGGTISRQHLVSFIQRRLDVGHRSPLYHVHFTFAVSGISRACANQLVRHHVGIAYEQQSLRYVTLEGDVPAVRPPSMAAGDASETLAFAMQTASRAYDELLLDGVPAEDARFVLPLGTETALLITANLAALLHVADERLCTQSQWEIRKLVARLRSEVVRVEPLLGRLLAPKCLAHRLGYCDEARTAWAACSLGGASKGTGRPHKTQVIPGLASEVD